MNVYRNFSEVEFDPNTVLTVGTFDGVHRGHQYIINKLTEISKNDNLRNLILTIHPHPQIILNKADKPPVMLLTSIEERLHLFEKFGVDNVLIIPFDYQFSLTPAKTFIIDYLIKRVGLKKILIGYDHLFGKDRNGNELLLNELALTHEFEIEKLARVDLENNRISSTAIRASILNSEIHLANELLGHHYGLRGLVVHGHKRGRTIGYPTANLHVDDVHKLLPPTGVYFIYSLINEIIVYGMANIGYRPTVTSAHELSIEAHFFDFDEDIYDQNITIKFVYKIRDEVKFESIDKLIEQLDLDKTNCMNMIHLV